MAKSKIAILGGKGMLGTDTNHILQKAGFDTTVYDLPRFDITDAQQLHLAVKDSDIIINCAAYTDVEKAETESELAYKVNAHAVKQLGKFAKVENKYVIHFSTDFVFDGTKSRPYNETDHPNPVNEYGRSKLEGENYLSDSGCKHCIIRIEWTYGLHGNNFVKKILQLAKKHEELSIVSDQIGSPTSTTEIANALCFLLPKQPTGLYHFAASEYTSRYQMAKFIFEKANINVNLTPCETSDFVTAAQRPLNSRFDCTKIQQLLPGPITEWQKPLEKFLHKLMR